MGRGHAVVLRECPGVDVVLEKKRKKKKEKRNVKIEDRAPESRRNAREEKKKGK